MTHFIVSLAGGQTFGFFTSEFEATEIARVMGGTWVEVAGSPPSNAELAAQDCQALPDRGGDEGGMAEVIELRPRVSASGFYRAM